MNDLIVQFARLWGQREAWGYSAKDQYIAEMLKAYDSEEVYRLLKAWVDEYFSDEDAEDSVAFFENKIEEIYTQEIDNEYIPSAENGDYSPSNPWDAPGMKLSDFI